MFWMMNYVLNPSCRFCSALSLTLLTSKSLDSGIIGCCTVPSKKFRSRAEARTAIKKIIVADEKRGETDTSVVVLPVLYSHQF